MTSPESSVRQRKPPTSTVARQANVPLSAIEKLRKWKNRAPWYKTRVPLGFLMQMISSVLLYHPVLKWSVVVAVPITWWEIGGLLGVTKRPGLNRIVQAVGNVFALSDLALILYLEKAFPGSEVKWLLVYISARYFLLLAFLFLKNTPYKDMFSFAHIVSCCTAAIALLRLANMEQFVIIIACVCCSDSFQYFFGKQFGKTKIVPSISPNKSLEGYVGGVLFSLLLGYIIVEEGQLGVRYFGFVMGMLLVAIGGDLAISSWKRFHHKKDTSTLLEGHGGVLDRLDSHFCCWLYTLFYLLAMGVDIRSNFTMMSYPKFVEVLGYVWVAIWIHWFYQRLA